jgi:hypothetical protein
LFRFKMTGGVNGAFKVDDQCSQLLRWTTSPA